MENGCRAREWICSVQLKKNLANWNIIAEDLGFLTESVLQMLSDSGFPGMKVIQFAFDRKCEALQLSPA